MTTAGEFVRLFNEIAALCHAIAVSKGWWEGERNSGECYALMHSELSEGFESVRKGDPPDDKIPEFSGQEAELADTIIRIMDYAAANGLRVAEALVAKMAYNQGRPYRHGGKTA